MSLKARSVERQEMVDRTLIAIHKAARNGGTVSATKLAHKACCLRSGDNIEPPDCEVESRGEGNPGQVRQQQKRGAYVNWVE